MKSLRGFTIVELLIVIVVIAILAAISVVAYNGIQDRSRTSKVSADLSNLIKAIHSARISANDRLGAITGTNCSMCTCPYLNGDMTDYSTLPKTHGCWTGYYETLNEISAASGVNLSSLREGDPWGSPYGIDENEGEYSGCVRDTVFSFGRSKNRNGGTNVGNYTIPAYSGLC